MQTTIKATFDNHDAAERTLFKIRDNNISIYKSSIKHINRNADLGFDRSILTMPAVGQHDESQYKILSFPFISRADNSLNRKIRRDLISDDVELKVTLPQEDKKLAEQVIINSHGREISELNSKKTETALRNG